ncbi:hypothetical protein [Streptomyces sp. NPDC090022]|uniref:hypothetical protein n=1 Tax=Streptomyces sp. NPDC090022 TaxID=3365920 RepID=UPI0038112480
MKDDRNDGQAPAPDDERALRALLHGAVSDLEPAPLALERLRHAVPARRARKRQALVGAAAAVLLIGGGTPAVLHLTDGTEHTEADGPAMAGHGQDVPGTAGTGSDPHATGSGHQRQPTGSPTRGATVPAVPDQRPGVSPEAPQTTAGGTSAAPTLSSGPQPPAAAPGVPLCTAGQLGVSGSAGTPDSDGKVYGSFRVTNVSALGCVVTGPDAVTASAGTEVLAHTPSDPAPGLPDPSSEVASLVLAPHMSYEVRYAWVPSALSCPAPTASDPQGPATGPAANTEAAAPPPQPPASPGVSVTLTARPGAPTAQTTLPSSPCAGTVYRTGTIPQSPTP